MKGGRREGDRLGRAVAVNVRFDDRVWGRMASMADNQGTTVPELIERAVERLLTGTTRSRRAAAKEARHEELQRSRDAHKTALVAEVKRLRANGHTIQAIADITGYSKTYVSRILCDNGGRTWTRSDAGTRQNNQQEKAA